MLYILVSDEGNEVLTNEQITAALEYLNIKDIYNANKEFYNLDNEYYLYPEPLIRKIVEERISNLENKYNNYWLVIHSQFIFDVIRLMKRRNLIKDATLISAYKNNSIGVEELVDNSGHLNDWPNCYYAWENVLGDLI